MTIATFRAPLDSASLHAHARRYRARLMGVLLRKLLRRASRSFARGVARLRSAPRERGAIARALR